MMGMRRRRLVGLSLIEGVRVVLVYRRRLDEGRGVSRADRLRTSMLYNKKCKQIKRVVH